MITIKTSPTQAMPTIDFLRLLARAPTDTDSPKVDVIVGLRISHREINDHDTSRSLALLNGLTQEKDIAWIARGKLVLSVDGYDNDPRELYEVPEVRRFIHSLHTRWKYWFFFANENYATLPVVCFCINGGTKVTPNITQVDADSFDRFYRECADACNDLCDKFGFPEEENHKRLLSAYQQLTSGR